MKNLSTEKINIIKVPNEQRNEVVDEPSLAFPRMNTMYLELLEDKSKIKPTEVNRSWDNNEVESVKSMTFPSTKEKQGYYPSQKMAKIQEEKLDDTISLSDQDYEDKESSIISKDDDSIDEEIDITEDQDNNDFFQKASKHRNHYSSSQSSTHSDEDSDRMSNTEDQLKNMIHDNHNNSSNNQYQSNIPKLSDLEKEGVFSGNRTIPTMDHYEDDEDEEDKKRELLFRFQLLKKSYQDTSVDIPEFNIHTSYRRMQDTYENTLRHISVDSSVEQYSNLLIGAFMLFEFILGSVFKFDMAGYTQHSVLNMAQYKRLLIELGHRSYTPEAEQYSPEIRLLGMVCMNSVIFIISKMILKKTGANLMNILNTGVREKYTKDYEASQPHKAEPNFYNSSTTNSMPPREKTEQRKKMKRPSFNFDDL